MKRTLWIIALAAFLFGFTGTAQAVSMQDAKLDISGIAQFGYTWTQETGGNDQLDTNRLRIRLRAQPTEGIMIFSQIEGTDNTSPNAFGENIPSNASPLFTDAMQSDSRLVDLYAVITYFDWVMIIAGQAPTPVSYEINTDEYDLETINYSQFLGIANRDRALALHFAITPEVNLDVWHLNGIGTITGANGDIDDRSTNGLMLSWNPEVNGKLNLKAFGNFGSASNPALNGMLNPINPTNKTEVDVKGLGLGFDYRVGPFHLMSEYFQAKITPDDLESAATVLGNMKTKEWYVHGGYMIPQTDLQLVLRFDRYDPDTNTSTDETEIFTVGMNWNFCKNARMQFMHEFKEGPASPDVDDDNTAIQLSVRF